MPFLANSEGWLVRECWERGEKILGGPVLELLNHPTVQAILSVAVLLIVVYLGIVVLTRLRPSTSKADMNVEDLAANFEEMRLEGDIDEAELRKIKSVLGKSQVNPPSKD